mmetsp:Transcript_4302/g.12982  ORF Transcript_4302/g.12982 Transcript_4302/m.12982 type:complete len:200 (+) Transcript_4302:464-1063(+)
MSRKSSDTRSPATPRASAESGWLLSTSTVLPNWSSASAAATRPSLAPNSTTTSRRGAVRATLTSSAVAAAARAASDAVKTMGAAYEVCTLPGRPPSGRLGSDEVELGLGIHGEPGAARGRGAAAQASRARRGRLVEQERRRECRECERVLGPPCLNSSQEASVRPISGGQRVLGPTGPQERGGRLSGGRLVLPGPPATV